MGTINSSKQICIVGGGLSGSLLAVLLAKRGFEILLLERRPDLRKKLIDSGRSINLALSIRGITALQKAGLAEKVLAAAIPMRGRLIHDQSGQTHIQPYHPNPNYYINAISRSGLNAVLLDEVDSYKNITVQFESQVTEYNPVTKTLHYLSGNTLPVEISNVETVIGTDGAWSAVRNLYFKQSRFNYSQEYIPHAYKELCIYPDEHGNFRMTKEALHIWPRGRYMLIALPNLDGTFTCTLFLDYHKHPDFPSFESLCTDDAIRPFFTTAFPDFVELTPDYVEQFKANPVGQLATIRCYPWHIGGQVLLLGDAAHAVVPFFGQGMNCSFEDCAFLDAAVERYGDNWELVFQAVNDERKPNADAIADLALENFIEMRDKTADPLFQKKRALELRLEHAYPDIFASKYSMVSFQNIPYTQALSQGKAQDEKLMALCKELTTPVNEVNLESIIQVL